MICIVLNIHFKRIAEIGEEQSYWSIDWFIWIILEGVLPFLAIRYYKNNHGNQAKTNWAMKKHPSVLGSKGDYNNQLYRFF